MIVPLLCMGWKLGLLHSGQNTHCERERCDFLAVVSEDCCLLGCDIVQSAKISCCFETVCCLHLGGQKAKQGVMLQKTAISRGFVSGGECLEEYLK